MYGSVWQQKQYVSQSQTWLQWWDELFWDLSFVLEHLHIKNNCFIVIANIHLKRRPAHLQYGSVRITQLKQDTLVATLGCYDKRRENIYASGYWSSWRIGLLKSRDCSNHLRRTPADLFWRNSRASRRFQAECFQLLQCRWIKPHYLLRIISIVFNKGN